MKISYLKILLPGIFIMIAQLSNAQTQPQVINTCATAQQLCLPYAFAPSTGNVPLESGHYYDCIPSADDPSWFSFQVDQSGSIQLSIMGNFGSSSDIDFVVWGPFSDPVSPCSAGLDTADAIQCIYQGTGPVTPYIPNAVSGEFYLMMVTNPLNAQDVFTIIQQGGTGSINCDPYTGICDIGYATTATNCHLDSSYYDLSGEFHFSTVPTGGSLVLTTCYGTSVTYNAPFSNPLVYSIPNQPANDTNCYITAQLLSTPLCIDTIFYNEPLQCPSNCITDFQVNVSPCNAVTNSYNISGTIQLSNPPPGEALTIQDCHGNSQTYMAPLPPTINFNLPGIPADGATCWLTASFSNDTTCSQTFNYMTPWPCNSSCFMTSLQVNVLPCDTNNYTYGFNGQVEFNDPPTTGTLTITDQCTGVQIVYNPPFTSPTPFSISGLPATSNPCDVIATFSDDPGCNISLGASPYTIPSPCDQVLSLSHSQLVQSLKIYPNPANEQFSIEVEMNEPENIQLNIFNALGQQVGDRKLSSNAGTNRYTFTKAGMNLTEGIYTIQIRVGKHTITDRIILN